MDLDGHDRYVRDHAPYDAPEYNVGMGESQPNGNYYKECQCFSLSVLLDAGGSSDFYSQAGRGDGISIAPGRPAAQAENSPLHGLFIDTKRRVSLW